MPVLALGRLHVFVVRLSPKCDDLLRDGRYALHATLPAAGGEEFYLTGRAQLVNDQQVRAAVRTASGDRLGGQAPADADPQLLAEVRERLDGDEFEKLFELDIDHVLYTVWEGWGTTRAWPRYRRWHAS
jgi:hypothetical protein